MTTKKTRIANSEPQAAMNHIVTPSLVEDDLRVQIGAMASSINGIGITDLEGTLLYVNDSLVRMWGYDGADEIVGKSLPQFWEGEGINQTVAELFEKGGAIGEDIGKRKDGSTFVAQFSASMIRDEAGNPMYMSGSFVDITDRKQMEEELKKAKEELEARVEQRTAELAEANSRLQAEIVERQRAEEALGHQQHYFRSLIENSADAFVVVAADGSEAYSSPSTPNVLGYDPDEREGGTIFDNLHPDDVSTVGTAFTSLMQEPGGTIHIEARARHKDGSWRFIEAIGRNLLDDPVVAGIAVTFRDITDRKQAEEALRRSEAYNRSLLENAMEAIAVVGSDGTIQYESPSYKRVLGRNPGDLVGAGSFDFIHQDDLPKAAELFAELLRNPSGTVTAELRSLRADGSYRSLEVTARNLLDDPVVSGIVANFRDITERKQAEEAVQLSEEYHRALFESSLDGIIVINPDATTRYLSPSFEGMLGYQPEERHGQSIFELIHEDDVPHIASVFSTLLENQSRSAHVEVRVRHKDGTWRHLEAVGHNLLDNPAVSGVVGNFRDITERKQAEEALQQQEQYFRSLIENSADGITVLNADGTVRYVSPSARSITGRDPQAEIGANPFGAVHPDDIAKATDSFEKLMQEPGLIVRSEIRSQHADGSWLLMESTAQNLLDNPAVAGIVINSRDITERRQAEEALQEQERHFRALIENSLDVISVLNRDGTIRYESPSIERVLGYSPEELVGTAAFELIHPDDLPGIRETFGQLALEPNRIVQAELRFRHKNGAWRNIEVKGHNLLDDPAVRGVITNFSDITERKQAEEDLSKVMANLERSNKELEQFAYVASHDLQEPLRMVASYTQLLGEHFRGQLDDEAASFINYATDGATRMQTLINDLLAYSRVGTRGKELEPTDCNAVLAQAITNLSIAIGEANATVTNDELPTVAADSAQLVQLLQNLVANAIKFHSEEAPLIHVSAREEGGEWLFSVRDNGIGIEPRFAERIFIMFRRLHKRDQYPGTGIGLAVCKKIVDRHGGRIWVESEPAKGSVFCFTIAKAQTPQSKEEDHAEQY
ncbi:MAG: PAS domain S-box protein [Dehalococcoidia bacterium]